MEIRLDGFRELGFLMIRMSGSPCCGQGYFPHSDEASFVIIEDLRDCHSPVQMRCPEEVQPPFCSASPLRFFRYFS